MNDDNDYIDITPTTHLLHSLRAGGRADYTALAGEGIDNSLDAGATRVEAIFSPAEIRFQDNGSGVRPKDIRALFSPGDHLARDTSRLGRYGVGIKVQALRAGNSLTVRSVYADEQGSPHLFVAPGSWVTILTSTKWRIPRPRPIPIVGGTPTGTEIIISELLEAPKFSFDDLRRDIALMFRPALAAGREIIVGGTPLEPIADPPIKNRIESRYEFDIDRSMTIMAGMVPESSPLKLVHIGFEHRIIIAGKRIGCGTYQGVSRLYARVQLHGKWKLSQFKDDLYDHRHKRELEAAIEDILRPLLEECAEASQSMLHERVILELNEMLQDKIAARPHRKRQQSTDKKPRDRESKQSPHGHVEVEKSDPTPSGPARAPKRTPALVMIDIEPGTAASIGEFDATGKVHRVVLYSNNPAVADAIQQRNRDRRSLRWLMTFAGSLYFDGLETKVPEPELQLASFGERMAWFLAKFTEGTDTGQIVIRA